MVLAEVTREITVFSELINILIVLQSAKIILILTMPLPFIFTQSYFSSAVSISILVLLSCLYSLALMSMCLLVR